MSSGCILQGIERLIRSKSIRKCKKYRELIQSHDKFCQLKRWNVLVELNRKGLKEMAMGLLGIQSKQNMSSSFSASFNQGCWAVAPWGIADSARHEMRGCTRGWRGNPRWSKPLYKDIARSGEGEQEWKRFPPGTNILIQMLFQCWTYVLKRRSLNKRPLPNIH